MYTGLLLGDNLFQFLTDIKWGFSSKVARRPVINRPEGEEIDIGTWTFSPIELTGTIRVDANGKSVLKNWFNANTITTIYLVSETGYWKMENAWFKEKKCTYEESTEYELNDRKWKFGITAVIESATFIPLGEIICPIGNQITPTSGGINAPPIGGPDSYIEWTLTEDMPVSCLSNASFETNDYRCWNRDAYVIVTYTDDSTTTYNFQATGYYWGLIDFLSVLTIGKTIHKFRIGISIPHIYGDDPLYLRNIQLTSGGTNLY